MWLVQTSQAKSSMTTSCQRILKINSDASFHLRRAESTTCYINFRCLLKQQFQELDQSQLSCHHHVVCSKIESRSWMTTSSQPMLKISSDASFHLKQAESTTCCIDLRCLLKKEFQDLDQVQSSCRHHVVGSKLASQILSDHIMPAYAQNK